MPSLPQCGDVQALPSESSTSSSAAASGDASTPWNLPEVTVIQKNGSSSCEVYSCFSVPVPPDDVFDLIIDPGNKRVFKNIKEVKNRRMIHDDGNRQVIEMEQVLSFFSSEIRVEQNRGQHTMVFDLVKKGIMKKFSGSWKVEAFHGASSDAADLIQNGSSLNDILDRSTGSWITFNQVVEPVVVPWPLKGFVRDITMKMAQGILSDLKSECMQIAQSKRSV